MNKYIFIPVILTLAGCSGAQKSTDITSEYIPANVYSDYSCKALKNEADRIVKTTPMLEELVDREYKKDKLAEAAAWVLFWPAALAMDGNTGERRSLAIARGRLEAIYANLNTKGC